MKLILNRKATLEAVNCVISCVPSRTTKVALNFLLLRFGGGEATLSASNAESSATVRFPLAEGSDASEGSVLLGARRLSTVLNDNKDETFEMDVEGPSVTVRFPLTETECEFGGVDPSEFPSDLVPVFDPDRSHFSVKAEDAARCLADVAYSVARQDTKFALTGVLFENRRNSLTLVATDTKKMSVATTASRGADAEFILPSSALSTLISACGKASEEGGEVLAQISHNRGHVSFYAGRFSMSSALMEGRFPPYREIMVKAASYETPVAAEQLLAAVRRATPPPQSKVDESGKPVDDALFQSSVLNLDFANRLTLRGSDKKAKSVMDIAPCDPPKFAKIDSELLKPALKGNAGETLKLSINHKGNVIQLNRGEGFSFVLMTMA